MKLSELLPGADKKLEVDKRPVLDSNQGRHRLLHPLQLRPVGQARLEGDHRGHPEPE